MRYAKIINMALSLWNSRIATTSLVLMVLLIIPPVANSETWNQTAFNGFDSGKKFMVELDNGSLHLSRDLNNRWHATGEHANDMFGNSVSAAGDVNNDGYDDVIVGADGYDDNNLDDAGRAYLFLGGPKGLATTPVWTATGEAAYDNFARSVSAAGDVNNDGYDDIIIGADMNDSESCAGKTYLYLGGPGGLATSHSWTATGQAAGDYFGYNVSAAGDVNNDGYDDVIVSAVGYNGYTGKTYLFLGTPEGLAPSWTAIGNAVDNNFGSSVSAAGDVNNDGYDDVIVGANGYDDYAGRAYLYLGRDEGLAATPAWTVTGEAAYNNFGSSVSAAGDVNNDGYDDVIVGSEGNSDNGLYAGKTYLYLGRDNGLAATSAWTVTGEAGDNNFGSSVSAAGDVNNDGYDDVIVGAHGNSNSGSMAGKAYLFLGKNEGLAASPVWTATGEAGYDNFGSCVSAAGDVDGDGHDDIIVGAHGNSSMAGRAYVFQNLDTFTLEAVRCVDTIDGAGYYDGYAGDVNGDGYDDVISTNSSYNNDTGRAYLYLGSPGGLATSPSWTVTGEAEYNNFGGSVSVGDVNNDGYDDVIISADGYEIMDTEGKLYLYLGGPEGLATSPSWTFTGCFGCDKLHLGYIVSVVGDVNNDGYDDVIAAVNDLQVKAYLFYGTSTGLIKSSWSGTAVTDRDVTYISAGDVNGDGYDDVIIGANGYDGYPDKTCLFLGGPGGLATSPSWTVTGEQANDGFGHAISVGDVNNDGYDDVIISADGYEIIDTEGKLYLYLGGPEGLTTSPSWTFTGEITHNFLGSNVSVASDLNNDGYDDFIVGAYGNLIAENTYLFLGNPYGLTPSLSVATGGTAIGDVDNDGYDDVISRRCQYSSPGYCEHGFFLSEIFSAVGNNIAKWRSLSWEPVEQPDNTGVRFQAGTSSNGVDWTFLGPDGTADTWYTQAHGQAIFSGQNGLFWRYKTMFDNMEAVRPPFLSSVSVNYMVTAYEEPSVTLTQPGEGEILIGGQEVLVSWNSSGNFGDNPINLYYSIDMGESWTVIAEGLADTGTYNWTVPFGLETSGGLLKITVVDIPGNRAEDITDGAFFIGCEKNDIQLFTGWNFVSTPARLGNTADQVQQVFAGVNTSGNPLYLYDNMAWAEMNPADTVTVLDGIWIYSAADVTVGLTFDSDPLVIPPVKALETGWNAIGHSARIPVSANSTLSSVESQWTYLLPFDASAGSYRSAIINNDNNNGLQDEDRPMYPTAGYWLYMTSAEELAGLGSGVPAVAAKGVTAKGASSVSELPRLPEAYYGTITINGLPAPAGIEIIAMINGVEKGRFTTTEQGIFGGPGTYDPKLIVSGTASDAEKTVTFLVNGVEATQTDSYDSGTNTELDLTFSMAPECKGDLDGDHDVDVDDLALLADYFGRNDCDSAHVCKGDIDEDGDVDGSDLALFREEFPTDQCR